LFSYALYDDNQAVWLASGVTVKVGPFCLYLAALYRPEVVVGRVVPATETGRPVSPPCLTRVWYIFVGDGGVRLIRVIPQRSDWEFD
jgi:hypothetical protein